jgi:hypothetical protein
MNVRAQCWESLSCFVSARSNTGIHIIIMAVNIKAPLTAPLNATAQNLCAKTILQPGRPSARVGSVASVEVTRSQAGRDTLHTLKR